ncbi:MAG: hypothetical protein SCK28_08905 [Bacillota bacterium]|nr:hypothetical protein [Bacillota bacterium]
MIEIDALNLEYKELNSRLKELIAAGNKSFRLINLNGQRYNCGKVINSRPVSHRPYGMLYVG